MGKGCLYILQLFPKERSSSIKPFIGNNIRGNTTLGPHACLGDECGDLELDSCCLLLIGPFWSVSKREDSKYWISGSLGLVCGRDITESSKYYEE